MNPNLKKNIWPVAVTAGALVLAIGIGLVPLLSSDGSSDTADLVIPDEVNERIAALEERLAALEGGAAGTAGGIDPALRAEIDQIVTGLVNQTSRISAFKKKMAPVTAWVEQGGPDRLAREMAHVNKAFINQTARVSAMRFELAPLTTWVSEGGGPDRLAQEMALINQALLRLTGRISAINDDLEALPGTVTGVDRLALRVENLESAVTQLHKRVRQSQGQVANAGIDPAAMETIEAKLDTIIDTLSAENVSAQ